MKSISIDMIPQRRPTTSSRRRRGNAEIELLLVIPVLLTILFLAGAALKLGTARLSNSHKVELNAYSQVVIGANVVTVGNVNDSLGLVVPGLDAVRPGLPMRGGYAHEEQRVLFTFGNTGLSPVNIADSVCFIDANWQFSAWPHAADQSDTQSWFTAYVDESHPPALVYSLGLQPPWRP